MKTDFINIEFVVNRINYGISFDYQPKERQTWEDPGCSASIEIYLLNCIDGTLAAELDIEWDDLTENTQEVLEQMALDYALDYN